MDDYLGAIKLFPYDFAPANWAYCQGQIQASLQQSLIIQLIRNMIWQVHQYL